MLIARLEWMLMLGCRSMGRWSVVCVNSTAHYSTSTYTCQRDRPSLLTYHRTRLLQPSDLSTHPWSPAPRCRSTSFQTQTWLSCRRRLQRTSTHHWAVSGQQCRARSSLSGRTAPASGALQRVDCELVTHLSSQLSMSLASQFYGPCMTALWKLYIYRRFMVLRLS